MKYIELLRQSDDAENWEQPAGFDELSAEFHFMELADAFKAEIHPNVIQRCLFGREGASFHGYLGVEFEDASDWGVYFSNFGRFATIIPEFEEECDDVLLENAAELIQRFGYVYIPHEIVSTDYSGIYPLKEHGSFQEHPNDHWDWFHRFFDWE